MNPHHASSRPVQCATALARGPEAAAELAAQAVQAALARLQGAVPHTVLLFLTCEFLRHVPAALAAASRAARCLNVSGCTAPGVLTEADWAIDQPAACALVLGGGVPFRPGGESPGSGLAFAVPEAAHPGWLSGIGPRAGLVSCSGDHPGKVWTHGKLCEGGAGSGGFPGARGATAVARGVRALSPPLPADGIAGYELNRINGQPALSTLLRALPVPLRAADTLPLNQLFLGVAAEGTPAPGEGFELVALLGINHEEGSVILSRRLAPGAAVFWALRTPLAAEHEMRDTVARTAAALGGAPAFGLLFSCIGRGPYYYGGADRDILALRERFPGLPLIGAYGSGQIAPAGAVSQTIHNSAVLTLVAPV